MRRFDAVLCWMMWNIREILNWSGGSVSPESVVIWNLITPSSNSKHFCTCGWRGQLTLCPRTSSDIPSSFSGGWNQRRRQATRHTLSALAGTNNVDNAARVCHAPSTSALKRAIGVAATTCSYTDVIDMETLYVKQAFVDGGSSQKRFRPSPMGRAHRYRRRTSHITIVIDET